MNSNTTGYIGATTDNNHLAVWMKKPITKASFKNNSEIEDQWKLLPAVKLKACPTMMQVGAGVCSALLSGQLMTAATLCCR